MELPCLCFPHISCKKDLLFFMFSCHFLWQALLSPLCFCFCLVFLSLVCLSLPSPVPLNNTTITTDKPQVCVHKLHPIFLCSLFFSVFFTWAFSSWGFSSVSVLLLEPRMFPLCEHWADCVVWLQRAAKPSDFLSGIQWVVIWLELQVSLQHHLGFALQQWRCSSKCFREKGVTDFTPQESYTVEIQFSKRKKNKGNIWEMQRALSEITLRTSCLLLAYKSANDSCNWEKIE